MLPLSPGAHPSAVLHSPASETQAVLSPDGTWLAYASDESGRREVYVRPLSGRGSRLQASTEGGEGPAWSADGTELYYYTLASAPTVARRAVMATQVTRGPSFKLGIPRLLFEGNFGIGIEFEFEAPRLAVAPDGQRFLMLTPSDDAADTLGRLRVINNWVEELKAKVPVK